MKTLSTMFAASALAFAFAAPVPSFAQGIDTTFIQVMQDGSMSAKSMLGAPVYNDRHEKIGTVDTIMVKPGAVEPMAVLSVGGYLGTGPKTVAVPLSHLNLQGKNAMVMAGATKEMLENLPGYSVTGG